MDNKFYQRPTMFGTVSVPSEQRGFVSLSVTGWIMVAMGTVVAMLMLAVTIQTKRLDGCQIKHAEFVAGVKVLGDAARAKAIADAKRDLLRKERSDAENTAALDAHAADLKRMRDANPGGLRVPAAPAGSSRPDLACYSRAELGRAAGALAKGVRDLADEGDSAVINLNGAKKWATELGTR